MLVWSSEYYPLLFFHVCTDDTARGNLEYIKSDYMNLGDEGQRYGGPGGFLLYPIDEGEGLEEEWMDPGDQQLAAQLVLLIEIWL